MDQVEEIKQKVDMVSLVGEYVQLKKAGRNYKGLCPFHGEKSPSFMVNPELQIFKCFGCQEGGDCFAFLQKIEGMTFVEALENLAAKTGVKLQRSFASPEDEKRKRLYDIHEAMSQVYSFLLNKHPIGEKVLEYALGRGITLESVSVFGLGFAPDSWDTAVKYLQKKGYTDKEMEASGLCVPGRSGLYDRFRNRLIFPLKNSRGQVVGFSGRVLPEEKNSKFQNPRSKQTSNSNDQTHSPAKYINSPETDIYHKGEMLYGFDVTRSEIKKTGRVVVVEGEIDAIASWQAGVKEVVAIKGSALTERHVELLARVAGVVILALDADLAGDSASRRAIEMCEKKGLVLKVAVWEEGKDPGDIATQQPESWKGIVDGAVTVYDFLLDSAIKRYGTGAEGMRKISFELLPIWAGVGDEIVKAHYVGKLAAALGVRDEDVRTQIGKLSKSVSGKTAAQGVSNLNIDTNSTNNDSNEGLTKERELREGRVILLAVLGKKTEELVNEPLVSMIKTPVWVKLCASLGENGIEGLPQELKPRLGELLLSEEEYSEKSWLEAVRLLQLFEVEEALDIETVKGSENLDVVRNLSRRKAELNKGK